MKKYSSLILLSLLFVLKTNAQDNILEKIPSKGKTVKDFIPNGYQIPQNGLKEGDLNKDGAADIAIALFSKEEEKSVDDPRLLLVLLKAPDGYILAGKSDKTILCQGCGGVMGDPYAGITIKNGILQINHYGGSAWKWTIEEKFRYQKSAFYLIGSTYDWYWVLGDCNGEIGHSGRRYKDINWVTGEEELIHRDEDCKLLKHIKHKNKIKPLIELEAFSENS
ncbi:MAG TPA: hypothetical protein VL092_10575 [Chitinophagaceae bacterium]|nr:hypothetical protein [Chitinophagaceae bacterium]